MDGSRPLHRYLVHSLPLMLHILTANFVFCYSRDSPEHGGVPSTPGGYVNLDFEMRNISKYNGETIRIKCEITGSPLPRYRWSKDGVPVDEISRQDERYHVKTTHWGSRLKIESIVEADSGAYTCEGFNRFGRQATTGSLHVIPGTNPKKERNRDREPDDTDYSYELPDLGQGDAREPGEEEDYDYGGGGGGREAGTGGDGEGLPLDPYNNFDTGPSYGGSRRHEFGKDFFSDLEEEKDGFCQPYQGAACSKFLSNKSIYVKSRVQQGLMEERLMAAVALVSKSVSTMSDKCSNYAIQALCYYAVAPCDETGDKPRPRKLCRDECQELSEDTCAVDYRRAAADPLLHNKYVLPNCSELPHTGSPEAENCIRIGLPMTRSRNTAMHLCFNDTGSSYKGTVSRTQSGYNCLKWSSIPLPGVVDKFSHLGDHNYCRNPGNIEDVPWCFTDNPSVPTEVCDIPRCPIAGEKGGMELIFILGPCIAVPVVLALLLTIICLCQRKKNANGGVHKPLPQAATSANQLEMDAMLAAKPPLKAREFAATNIHFLQEIGEGCYGKVYRGELIGYFGDNSITQVMVKTMKDKPSAQLQQDFRQEVDAHTSLKHANVTCLLGVCQRPVSMLYDATAQTDLHEFLIIHSPHSDISVSDDEGTQRILDHRDMMNIAAQCAAGMEYLASHSYIHRDLAARSVLVGENMSVKISGFGILRGAYSSDYYCLQNQSLVPVRWMPPEAILYAKFNTESDIWSYGVLLWEIYSYGLQPYYGYSNQEVIQMIRGRQILPCPQDCPSMTYSLMVECWHEMPLRRPSFTEILQRLRQWQAETVASINHNHRLLSVAHSQSVHSGSTQHSGNSGHVSHHSSTGPSNNTNSTGLSAGQVAAVPQTAPTALHMAPGQQQQQQPAYFNHPNHVLAHNHFNHNSRPPMYRHPAHMAIPPPPPNLDCSPAYNSYAKAPAYTHGHQHHQAALYKKPSPPGSVSSHHSSSLHSSPTSSSNSNYKPPNHNNIININANNVQPPSDASHAKHCQMHSPTTAQNNMVNSFNKLPNTHDLYIPDTRMSEL